jgi:TonB-dependent SusC/RagA subfamily outer membrane receptor
MRSKIIITIALSLILSGISFCQSLDKKIVIRGVVTDVKQKPIEGALIFIDMQNTNICTDKKGCYKVKAKPSASIISVVSSRYGVSKAVIDGQTEINFNFSGPELILADSMNNIGNEEFIEGGYGSQKKKDMTTSISKIDGQALKFASYPDIYSMISGEVPGVRVVGKSITIRGRNSINMGGQPLFVVDGTVMSSIDNISPKMVKSIEIIKDGSAAIYGSRGANGVIIITLLR